MPCWSAWPPPFGYAHFQHHSPMPCCNASACSRGPGRGCTQAPPSRKRCAAPSLQRLLPPHRCRCAHIACVSPTHPVCAPRAPPQLCGALAIRPASASGSAHRLLAGSSQAFRPSPGPSLPPLSDVKLSQFHFTAVSTSPKGLSRPPPTASVLRRCLPGELRVNVHVNVNNLLAISKSDFDNSGEAGPQAEGVNHLETPLRQLQVSHRASSCAKRGGHMKLCSKPRGARGIEPKPFRRRGKLLSRPPTTGQDVKHL